MSTKLAKILRERGLSQTDLVTMIERNTAGESGKGFKIGRDRISKICSGITKNMTLETATMIAEALKVPVDAINELKDIKKQNLI